MPRASSNATTPSAWLGRTPLEDAFGAGQKIISCAFSVSNALDAGFLEKIYQNALLIELENAGLQAEKKNKYRFFIEELRKSH